MEVVLTSSESVSLSLLLLLEYACAPENKNQNDDQYDRYNAHNDADLLSVRRLVLCRLGAFEWELRVRIRQKGV